MRLAVAICVLSTVFVWVAVGVERIYENFDGLYYVVVAKSWYQKGSIAGQFSFPLPLEYYPAHFPLYPALIWATAHLGLLNYLNSMLAVNLAASVAVTVLLIFLGRQYRLFKNPVWFAVAWLFWWPRIWAVRSIGSPETIFIGLLLTSLYFFDTKRYWWSGITGGLAVLTKSPGILLFVTYLLLYKRQAWPVILIPVALAGLFGFYYLQTGDFWAYLHSGDNIHLQIQPFKVFDASQAWVGTWWLEEVLWIYLIGGIGVWRAYIKNRTWGTFGLVFLATIAFVSHRDVSRYALPLVPVVLFGLSELFDRRDVQIALVLSIIPAAMFTINFLLHNYAPVANWAPLF